MKRMWVVEKCRSENDGEKNRVEMEWQWRAEEDGQWQMQQVGKGWSGDSVEVEG